MNRISKPHFWGDEGGEESTDLVRQTSNTEKIPKVNEQSSLKMNTTVCVFLSCQIRVVSESTLCNCLNVKELPARSRRDV